MQSDSICALAAIGLLLAACEERTPPTAEAPQSTPVRTAQPTATVARRADIPTGRFDYQAEGSGAELTIADAGAGRYKVSIDIGSAECNGHVDGMATRGPDGLAFESAPDDLDLPACRASIAFEAGKPRVHELEGCGPYHGRLCAFSSYP